MAADSAGSGELELELAVASGSRTPVLEPPGPPAAAWQARTLEMERCSVCRVHSISQNQSTRGEGVLLRCVLGGKAMLAAAMRVSLIGTAAS